MLISHNVRRRGLGGQQDHEEVHPRRRDVCRRALVKVVELNSAGRGAVERRGRALRHAQGATQTTGLVSMMADFGEKFEATVCLTHQRPLA